jgi:hypothetical protein
MAMQFYRYKYIDGIVLTKWDVDEILRRAKEDALIDVTVDFGLRVVSVRVMGEHILFPDGTSLSIDMLSNIREGFAYKLISGRLLRLDFYVDGNYYKLKPVAPTAAPTLEINGIQMHRTVGTDPWRDTIAKVSALGSLKNRKVLDICTGLGYTAIAEMLQGAEKIITIEKDVNVLFMASLNPWSRSLENEKIEIVVGDASQVIKELESESFDAVLHDPPRFSIAGELYSLEFYREIFRVLKKGGKLFHYTGEPGKHTNVDILKGIKRRLEEAGFEEIVWIDRAKGFRARKPY